MDRVELREARKRMGMTQAELAKALDLPRGTVQRWETGEVGIRHPKMLELALRELEREHRHGNTDTMDG